MHKTHEYSLRLMPAREYLARGVTGVLFHLLFLVNVVFMVTRYFQGTAEKACSENKSATRGTCNMTFQPLRFPQLRAQFYTVLEW